MVASKKSKLVEVVALEVGPVGGVKLQSGRTGSCTEDEACYLEKLGKVERLKPTPKDPDAG